MAVIPADMSDRDDDRRGAAALAPALLLLFLTAAATVGLSLRPGGGGQVGVLFPPGFGFAQAAAAVGNSGGAVVRTGAFGNLLVAASDAPDFPAALRQAGAVAVFNPLILGGCLAGWPGR